MDNTYYFSHDYNAAEDEKIKRLIFKWNLLGYGVYWRIIEMLYQNDGVLRLECERIAFELRTDIKVIESVISDYDLFQIADGQFTSRSVLKRLNFRKLKSKKARESAEIKWKKHYANAERTQSERYAIKERKGKEIKGKESIPPYPPNADIFWEMYPNKKGKVNFLKSWIKLKPEDQEAAIKVLPNHCKQDQWIKDQGKFIPHPATWLNQRRWEDELIAGFTNTDSEIYTRDAQGRKIYKSLTKEEYENYLKQN